MTIPELYNVCMANPATQFVMLTGLHPSSLFINKPENLTVKGVDLKNYKGAGGMRRLLNEVLKEHKIDLYIDLHDVIRTKLLRLFSFFKGIRSYKLRKGRSGKSSLTRKNHKVLLQLKPTMCRYREAFQRAGLQTGDFFKTLFPPGAAVPALPFEKREGEKWLAVAPFAKHPGKIYPPEQMEEVIAHYAERGHHRIFVFGYGEVESEIIRRWSEKWPDVVNMAGMSLGLPAELVLLKECDVMVSMDSANMHFASLVGLRTVSIWGATHPFAGFMGWNQSPEDVVQLDMTCRPCSVFGNKPCIRGDYHCLRGISPQLIIDKIDGK